MAEDSFQLNLDGVKSLVDSGLNKSNFNPDQTEGISGDYQDKFELKMKDEDLIALAKEWQQNNAPYDAKIEARSKKNKAYLLGLQRADQEQDQTPVASNILLEALQVYLPQALAKNPEPVVYSDNTPEGKQESNDLKTMLQYHTVELELRGKLEMVVLHESVYFIGALKHGWDSKTKDITTGLRKPKNFILDKDGYIDEFKRFIGNYLGEKIESTAGELIDMYPHMKEYIVIKTNGKLGTPVIRTEWWTDAYTFTTFGEKVLEKHKNPYFNYDKTEKGEDEYKLPTESVTKGNNHFSHPMMPYTFFSVGTLSLQEQPHDVTNLIEQNLKNQDRIVDRDMQIDANLSVGNNAVAISGKSFNQETAAQAVQTFYGNKDGTPSGFVLVPDGRIEEAIHRIPANPLPNGVLEAQEVAKNTLRSVFGVQGLSAQAPNDNTTAHGMVLNQEYDSTRIGGGVGKSIEATARNVFNWWTQLYYVFYDEPHYASVMGNGKAVEYISLQLSNSERRFVVTVAPNSMAPKDELSERNNTLALWEAKALDPLTLFQRLDDPDPLNTAKKMVLWTISPQTYMQQYFPEQMAQAQQSPQSGGDAQLSPNIENQSLANNASEPNAGQTPLGQQAPLPSMPH